MPRNTGVEKLCQATDLDFGGPDRAELGWILTNTHQEESLVVSFETTVFINEVLIYESVNPGSVVKLESMEGHRSTRTVSRLVQNRRKGELFLQRLL